MNAEIILGWIETGPKTEELERMDNFLNVESMELSVYISLVSPSLELFYFFL